MMIEKGLKRLLQSFLKRFTNKQRHCKGAEGEEAITHPYMNVIAKEGTDCGNLLIRNTHLRDRRADAHTFKTSLRGGKGRRGNL